MLPYLADKNALVANGYRPCFEFLYDNSDPDPTNWLYYRRTIYDQDLAVLGLEQLGNAGVYVDTTFEAGSPIGDFNEQRTSGGEMPSTDLLLPDAAEEVESLDEHYNLHGMPVRVLWVHPGHLDLAPVTQSVGEIVRVTTVNDHASVTVRPAIFDESAEMVPRTQVRSSEWPALLGGARRSLG